VIISASQYQTYLSCKRKWALERIWRLPQVQDTSAAQLFGIITHAAIARWLNADDTGRDAAGNPVDPFCPGWRKCPDGEITDDEDAAEIQALVALGIDSGILLRRPGREVERKIEMPVIRGVDMLGYIDLCLTGEAELQDHKVSKTSRYCLSEDKLVANPQMLMYAAWMFYERHSLGLEDRPILVRHNLFIRQPTPRTKVVEAHIDLPAVDEFWLILTQAAQEMLDLRSSLVGSPEYTKGEWACVEGAKDTGTCNAYGGCPFIGICGGRCSMTEYVARVTRIREKADQKFDQEKEVSVGLFDKLVEKKRAKLPCQKQEEETTPAPEPCKACGGKGENSKGFPCKACITNSAPKIPDTTPEPAPVAETASAPESVPAPPKIVLDPKPEQAPETTPADAPEVTTEVTGEVATEVVAPKKKRGRPRKTDTTPFPPETYLPQEARINPSMETPPDPKSLTLYVRCMPSGRGVTCVERLLKAAMQMIMDGLDAEAPETFWHLDQFRRRDMLAVAAGRVEILTDIFVAAPDSTPEMKAFVQGLRQRFENIVEGI